MLKISLVHYEQSTVLPLQEPVAVLLVSRGEGVLRVGSDRVALLPGRVFLLRQEAKVYLEGEVLTGHLLEFQKVLLDHYLLQNINHRDKGLFDFGLALAFADIRTNTLFFLMSLIGQLLDELEEGSDVSIFQHYLFLFLWHINRKVAEMNVHLSERERVMKKVMLLIEEHYIDQRSPLFYAGKLGMSDRHMNDLTRAATGKILFDLLTDRVMVEAQLLLRTDLPIKVIAYELGFSHQGHFSTYYQRYKGITPRVVRGQG